MCNFVIIAAFGAQLHRERIIKKLEKINGTELNSPVNSLKVQHYESEKKFFFLHSKIVQIFNLRTKLKLFSHSNPHFASIAKRKAGIPSSRLERKQTIFS